MALRVIGAGFGRTGTDSMRTALNLLGFGPCHHMREVIHDPGQLQIWRELAAGSVPCWDQLFSGFRSAVDWPSAHYWRELIEVYPDARVLLTTRNADDWYASINKTIFDSIRQNPDTASLGSAIIGKATFNDRMDDVDYVKSVFIAHEEEVKRVVPAARLLVHEARDGWGPLCDFLQVPVPDEAYPRTNSAAEFIARRADRQAQRGGSRD